MTLTINPFSWICFLQVVKHASKIRKDASLNTFEESTIPDESLYSYHRKCCQEYTHKQKLQRMVAKTQVAIGQKKSGRGRRIEGTCNKLLNAHSLLREICVGQLLTPFSFHVIFKTVQNKTSQLPRAGEFPLNYF